ncbi:MAG TPA: hypothetical protein VLW50_31010 [Streptosporangiaceae bacterium]|nr:hypothetical protein [Streptosporangiaceae bacterium]
MTKASGAEPCVPLTAELSLPSRSTAAITRAASSRCADSEGTRLPEQVPGLAARAGDRGVGAHSRVRLRRALVRAGQPGSSGWFRRPSLTRLHDALTAAAMVWMVTAVPGAAGVRSPGHGHGAMAARSGAAPSIVVCEHSLQVDSYVDVGRSGGCAW